MRDKNNINIFLIFFITIVSRLPFIWNSPGFDPDNWLVLFTGQEISRTGNYIASRLPGYPISEYLVAFLGSDLWWIINIITVLFSAFGMIYFYKILDFFDLKNKTLTTLTLSFIQGIFIASTVNMEYMWSIFFILSGVYYLLKKRYLLSGFLIGMMVATRFTNVVLLLPISYLIFFMNNERIIIKLIQFCVAILLTFCICFFPVFKEYGIHIFPSEIWYSPSIKTILSFYTLHLYGIIGIFGLLIAVFFAAKNYSHILPILKEKKELIIFSLLVIITTSISFFRFPFESYYNLPFVPFLIIILNIILFSERIKKIVFIILIVSPFVGYVSLESLKLKGSIFVNENLENDFLDYTEKIHKEFNNKNVDKKILIAGGFYSAYKCIYSKDNNKILKRPSEREIIYYISKGYDIYYPSAVKNEIAEEQHYDITKYGESILPPLVYDR